MTFENPKAIGVRIVESTMSTGPGFVKLAARTAAKGQLDTFPAEIGVRTIIVLLTSRVSGN
jgi:hypothetical protein